MKRPACIVMLCVCVNDPFKKGGIEYSKNVQGQKDEIRREIFTVSLWSLFRRTQESLCCLRHYTWPHCRWWSRNLTQPYICVEWSPAIYLVIFCGQWCQSKIQSMSNLLLAVRLCLPFCLPAFHPACRCCFWMCVLAFIQIKKKLLTDQALHCSTEFLWAVQP